MFQDIIEQSKIPINGDEKAILAHKEKERDYEEPIYEHVRKTEIVFEYIVEKDNILEELYPSLKKEYEMGYDYSEFKKILLEMVEFHDFGKINPVFQKERIGNDYFDDVEIPTVNHITKKHSLVGAIFFAIHLVEEQNLEENPILLFLPHIIHGHHTRLRSLFEEGTDFGVASILENEKYSDLKPTINYLFQKLPVEKTKLENLLQKVIDLYESEFFSKLDENSSHLSFLYNYLFSVLIRSDFIASSYSDSTVNQLENKLCKYYRRIDDETLAQIDNNFEKKQKEYFDKKDENPLNPYRLEMYQKALNSLEKGLKKNKSVFFLQMPTGGGKTHTSLGLSLQILKETGTDRIIYSLPYISLLEQNYEYFKKVLKLPTKKMRSIYSFSEIPEENEEKILTYDDFFEYPIICTTNVSLLESIVKFDKSSKYRFGALTNSVIILDEVQTLPVEYWPEFYYLLNEMAEKMNSYILIMSATLPGLEKLKKSRGMDFTNDDKYHYLISEPQKYYEKFERNTIVSEGMKEIEKNDSDDIDELVDYILKVSKDEFEENNNHGLIVVNTVRTSKNLYDKLKNELEAGEAGIDCLLLNSTILSARKREIVEKVNHMEKNKRLILVSTQSVEAGLDVSFDFVMRDFSTLESIEQVRGRCNRNREIEDGHVYLTKITSENTEASKVYPDWRLDETKKILDKSNYSYKFEDLETYFESTIGTINDEISKDMELTATDNIKCWNKMKFEETNSPRNKQKNVFHVDVIEENKNSYTFFISTSLGKENFDEKEIEFIEGEYNIQIDKLVDGDKIMELYKEKMSESQADYSKKKIIKKRFSSIMSKFTVSAILPTDERELESTLEKTGPYYKIPEHLIGDEEHHIYSLDKGFNKDYFQKKNNII